MSNLITPRESSVALEAAFAARAWQLAQDFGPWVQFASGKWANNKMLMDSIINDDQSDVVQDALLDPLAKIVDAANPDVLWGIPSGGQLYATRLGKLLDIPVVHLEKKENKPGLKTYSYVSKEDREKAASAYRAVVVEDASTEFTSLWGAMRSRRRLVNLANITVKAAIGLRRGDPNLEKELGIPADAVIEEYIPNMIAPKDEFFKRHGHRAVKVDVNRR